MVFYPALSDPGIAAARTGFRPHDFQSQSLLRASQAQKIDAGQCRERLPAAALRETKGGQ
jgi:hypothetical protein